MSDQPPGDQSLDPVAIDPADGIGIAAAVQGPEGNYTLIGIVRDVDTGETVRVIWPVEGDRELDDPEKTLFGLDGRNVELVKVARDDPQVSAALNFIVGGTPPAG